jgi:hypothetical protein
MRGQFYFIVTYYIINFMLFFLASKLIIDKTSAQVTRFYESTQSRESHFIEFFYK